MMNSKALKLQKAVSRFVNTIENARKSKKFDYGCGRLYFAAEDLNQAFGIDVPLTDNAKKMIGSDKTKREERIAYYIELEKAIAAKNKSDEKAKKEKAKKEKTKAKDKPAKIEKVESKPTENAAE